ncbi:MAG: ABC transporter permease [Draconibacterium sp.]
MSIPKRHPIFMVMGREAEKIKHNTAYRFLLFLGPLIGIFLLYFIFRQGVTRDLPIAVVDHDNSSLSIKLRNALEASPDLAVLASPADIFQAREMLESAQVDAIVLLPSGLENKVYREEEAVVPAYINGTNVLTGGIIQRAVLKTVGTISAGIQLKKQLLNEKNEAQAMARVMPVELRQHILFNPYGNYNYFLNSAMMNIMLYLFAFLASIYTFGNELKRGTGRELLEASNSSVRLAIAGKMFPYTVIFTGFAMLINVLLYEFGGMPMNGSFFLILFGQLITMLTYQLLGVWLVGLTYNLRLSLSIASAYSMMAVTFSGLTFPFEGMPLVARIFAAFFPFTWWEKLFISQSLYGGPKSDALIYICYILIFQLLAFTGFKLYKRRLGDEKYWGKA